MSMISGEFLMDCYADGEIPFFFIANRPTTTVEMAINWDTVLGYGQRPRDVYKAISEENDREGPYSWDLACKITKIARLGDVFKRGHPVVSLKLFNEWFDSTFSNLRMEKLQGVKKPATPNLMDFLKRLLN